jgi:hypothetical protein
MAETFQLDDVHSHLNSVLVCMENAQGLDSFLRFVKDQNDSVCTSLEKLRIRVATQDVINSRGVNPFRLDFQFTSNGCQLENGSPASVWAACNSLQVQRPVQTPLTAVLNRDVLTGTVWTEAEMQAPTLDGSTFGRNAGLAQLAASSRHIQPFLDIPSSIRMDKPEPIRLLVNTDSLITPLDNRQSTVLCNKNEPAKQLNSSSMLEGFLTPIRLGRSDLITSQNAGKNGPPATWAYTSPEAAKFQPKKVPQLLPLLPSANSRCL